MPRGNLTPPSFFLTLAADPPTPPNAYSPDKPSRSEFDDHPPFRLRDRRRLVRDRRRQGAARARDPVRLLREVRPGRRQLGVRQHQRHVLGVPLAAHQHLARADGVHRLPDAEVVSRLPAPHADRAVLRRLRRPLRLPRARSRSRPASSAPSGAPTASGRSRSRAASAAATTRCSSPTATTGIRAGPSRRSPGSSTARRCTRTTTSRTPTSATRTCSSSGSATARWTSPSSRASSREHVPVLAARRVHPSEVPVRPSARPDRRQRDDARSCRSRFAGRS